MELKLDLKKITIAKLNSLEEIKGGGTSFCTFGPDYGNTVSQGYQPDGYDSETNQLWKPCDRES